MSRRQVVLAVLLLAVCLRIGAGHLGNFQAADLARFEEQTGIDLPDWYAAHPALLTWTRGDGVAYVVLAIDPAFNGPSTQLMSGSYRFLRIGYSILGRGFVLGNPALVPIGLLAVNLAAIGVYVFLAEKYSTVHPRMRWLIANPAIYIGFIGGTAEPAGLALLFIGLVATQPFVSGVVAALLGTVRPSYATVLPAGRTPLATLCAALSLTAIAFVSLILGDGDFGTQTFVFPATGYLSVLRSGSLDGALVAGAAFVVLLWALLLGIRRTHATGARIAWLATSSICLSLAPIVLADPHNLLRALGHLPLLVASRFLIADDRLPNEVLGDGYD